jgi:glutamine synthetase
MSHHTPRQLDETLLLQFVNANEPINFFRLLWVDFFGVVRARVLTKAHCLQLTSSQSHLSVGSGVLWAPYVPEKGRQPRGGVAKLYPDWSSLRACPYAPKTADVMCFVREQFDAMDFLRDPRTILSSAVSYADRHNGIQALVGFEIEFWLLEPSTTPPTPIQNGKECWSLAGLRGPPNLLLQETVLSLESAGIVVLQYHTENADGFFEIVTGPLPPVQAVDALYYSIETIKTIAMRHNLRATVFPKPSGVNVFAGAHAHISISPVDQEEKFLAGILGRLPQICAMGMPNIDSYHRVRDLAQTTGVWVGYGTEFRDIPVRKICRGRWEIRCVDGTTNMYLTLASVLGSGCAGMDKDEALTWKDCQTSPSLMDQQKRLMYGITTKLPQSLKEALTALKDGAHLMEEFMGKEFLEKWLHHKTKEEEYCAGISEEERTKMYLRMF